MILKVNQKKSILIVILLILFIPGYFNFYSPFISGSYQNIPLWGNVIIVAFIIFTVLLTIKSFSFQIKITKDGITQITFGRWTVGWNEMQGWEHSEVDDINYLYLELTACKGKKELLPALLTQQNLAAIKSVLEEKVGQPMIK